MVVGLNYDGLFGWISATAQRLSRKGDIECNILNYLFSFFVAVGFIKLPAQLWVERTDLGRAV